MLRNLLTETHARLREIEPTSAVTIVRINSNGQLEDVVTAYRDAKNPARAFLVEVAYLTSWPDGRLTF